MTKKKDKKDKKEAQWHSKQQAKQRERCNRRQPQHYTRLTLTQAGAQSSPQGAPQLAKRGQAVRAAAEGYRTPLEGDGSRR